MPWLTFTPDHVKARLTAREAEAYEEIATREFLDEDGNEVPPTTTSPRIDEIVSQICHRIRGAIRANPRVAELGPAGTIPDFCIHIAASLGRHDMIAMMPTDETSTDTRKAERQGIEKEIEALRTMDPKAFAITEITPPWAEPVYGGSKAIF